jgi:hypothetical protein
MQHTRMSKSKYLLVVFVACSLQFSIRDSRSCSVPVFRYALERWKPDAYKGIYIHQGKITKEDQTLLQQLEELRHYRETVRFCLAKTVHYGRSASGNIIVNLARANWLKAFLKMIYMLDEFVFGSNDTFVAARQRFARLWRG